MTDNDFYGNPAPFTPEDINKAAQVIPDRQDITVLPADNPKELRLGWVIYESVGWAECDGEVANMDTGDIFSSVDWTDFDWEIYNLAVHNNKPDYKRKPTKRNKIEKLIKKLKENPQNYSFAEMHFFVYATGISDGWGGYKGRKDYHWKFNEWLKTSGVGGSWGSDESVVAIFPQHENLNQTLCKICVMENALNYLNEYDEEGNLGCYLNLVKNDQEVHCYQAIGEEMGHTCDKTYAFFAAYNRIPTREELKHLLKGVDYDTIHKEHAEKIKQFKQNMPSKWEPYRHGLCMINDYATGKVKVVSNDTD